MNTTNTTATSTLALPTLSAGLLLGLAADRLWTDYGPTPLTLLLLFGSFCGGALWLARRAGSPFLKPQTQWSALALTCIGMMLWRDTKALNALLMLSTLATMALFLLQRSGLGLKASEPHHALSVGLLLFSSMCTRPLTLLRVIPLQDRLATASVRGAVLGLLIALPLLILFWQLFIAADAAFERWALQLRWWSPTLPLHAVSTLVLGWIASGVMGLAWQPVTSDRDRFRLTLGATEVTIVLAALEALFVLFAGFQLASLSNSPADNAARSGLSIAEFARHGFFQLLWIAALALGVLALLSGCAAQVWYRRLGTGLLACVVVVMAASLQRLDYYLDSYGLTIDRIVACAVLLWLALCITAFGATVLLRRSSGFLALATALAIVVCMVVTSMNPAAVVVKTNVTLSRAQQQQLDMDYLLGLGSDAVPALIKVLPALSSRDQCSVATALIQTWWNPLRNSSPAQHDWRHWHASPLLAAAAVHKNISILQQAARRTANTYYDDVANFEQPLLLEPGVPSGCE